MSTTNPVQTIDNVVSAPEEPTRLLRRREVEARTGRSRANIYALIAQGKFPAPVKLGPGASAWVEEEIEQHIRDMIAARDTQ